MGLTCIINLDISTGPSPSGTEVTPDEGVPRGREPTGRLLESPNVRPSRTEEEGKQVWAFVKGQTDFLTGRGRRGELVVGVVFVWSVLVRREENICSCNSKQKRVHEICRLASSTQFPISLLT